jgi:hypothetical protein
MLFKSLEVIGRYWRGFEVFAFVAFDQDFPVKDGSAYVLELHFTLSPDILFCYLVDDFPVNEIERLFLWRLYFKMIPIPVHARASFIDVPSAHRNVVNLHASSIDVDIR